MVILHDYFEKRIKARAVDVASVTVSTISEKVLETVNWKNEVCQTVRYFCYMCIVVSCKYRFCIV